ncbi:UNVERIFIED_CONTAM: Serrate RNA effector molecule [Sesamum radiatum]|uniref:Serrate RNA effector molecule n=1 Tax=Sesamum radiatum TaxID=300843 RepID=A0AAW2UNN8_SESRA
MAEVATATEENLERRRERSTTTDPDNNDKPSDTAPSDAGPDATSSPPPPPPPPRRGIRDRERDSRERRDDRDLIGRRGVTTMTAIDRRRRRRHAKGIITSGTQNFERLELGQDVYNGFLRARVHRHIFYAMIFNLEANMFGYDYPGGYDREMGGRPGYPDERPHGRYMGRSGGYQDWDSGRGGFADAFNAGGAQREGMMSYKQFIQELEDDILPAEAERRYQEYRTEYISTQKRTYFNAHKDEEWLKDKYHPTNLVAVIERRNELARKLAKDFQLDLQSGTLDLGPAFSPPSSSKAEQSSEPNSDDEADVGGKRRRPGRGGAKESDLSSAPKAHPICSEPRRIQVDVEQAQALVRKLDAEKGIEDNVLCRADNDRMNRDKSHGSSSGPVIIIRGLTAVKAKGFRHVRVDGKSSDTIANGNEWRKKLDSHWQERLKGSDPLEVMTAKEKIDATAAEALDPYVRKIRDESMGGKLVMELTSKVRELYFQNYMSDENAPGGTPVMQPSFPKEKPQRRRPGYSCCCFCFRYTSSCADDAVPGAGPLGPFVPAPPEVAMRMLRDQGGPPPFEGGRNGRSGPQLGGPSPIIALPPTLRQDPRRLRRSMSSNSCIPCNTQGLLPPLASVWKSRQYNAAA